MPALEKLIIERKSGDFDITLTEVQPIGPMPAGRRLMLKVWKLVISDAATALADLESHVEIWFHDFTPAMFVTENIYRHGDFNGDKAVAKAIKAKENPDQVVRICATQDFRKANAARIVETEG